MLVIPLFPFSFWKLYCMLSSTNLSCPFLVFIGKKPSITCQQGIDQFLPPTGSLPFFLLPHPVEIFKMLLLAPFPLLSACLVPRSFSTFSCRLAIGPCSPAMASSFLHLPCPQSDPFIAWFSSFLGHFPVRGNSVDPCIFSLLGRWHGILCSFLANELCVSSLTLFSFRAACSFGKLIRLFPLIVEFGNLPRLCLHVCFFPSFLPGIQRTLSNPIFLQTTEMLLSRLRVIAAPPFVAFFLLGL